MIADSTLELKTLLLGAETIFATWTLLSGLGVLWLALFWKGAEVVFEKPAIEASEQMAVKVFLFFTAVVLAGTPHVQFDATTLVYEDPGCESLTFAPGASGYAQIEGEGAEVPILVAAVLSLGSGFSRGALASIGCQDDIRHQLGLVLQEEVDNPLHVDEVSQFLRDCHAPAKARFYGEAALNQGVGEGATPEDWLWAFFLDTPGYYDSFQAVEQVATFPFDPSRDTDPGLLPERGGLPMCDEWLYDLRDRLLASMDPLALEEVRQYGQMMEDNGEPNFGVFEAENGFLYHIVMKTIESGSASAEAEILSEIESRVSSQGFGLNFYDGSGMATSMMATAGAWLGSAFVYPWLSAIKMALPLARAIFLLLLLAAYMPLVIFSGFKFSTLVTWSTAVMVVLAWPWVWALISVLENMLALVFFPDPGSWLGTIQAGANSVFFAFRRMVFDVVFGVAMLLAPLWLFKVAGWAGARTEGADGIVSGLTSGAAGSIKDGTSKTTSLATGKIK